MAMYGYVCLCRTMYGYVGLFMAVYVLCMAKYGYTGLCTFMVGCIYTLLVVTNVKPLYDAYTTYLPLASCKGLPPRALGDY